MNRTSFRSLSLTLLALMLTAGGASAALIPIDALDTGFYDQTGAHIPTNETYLAGQFRGDEDRSFYVFDLSGVSGIITAASLNLYNPGNLGICCNGYVSPDPTETFALFDVTTPISTLVAGGAGQTDVFDDLGSGTAFGQRIVSAADNDTVVQISLNAAALAALNVAIGETIAFGGALQSISGPADQLIFGFSTAPFVPTDIRLLDLTVVQSVPEPTSLSLLGLSVLMLSRFSRAVRARHRVDRYPSP